MEGYGIGEAGIMANVHCRRNGRRERVASVSLFPFALFHVKLEIKK